MNEWIMGICDTEFDGIEYVYVLGTEEQVKEYMLKLIKEERETEEKKDLFDFGTETIEELQTRSDGSIYGYNNFEWGHTDYEATKTNMIKTINL